MKKSILSLSAAVALGGLGLATSAQAIVYFGASAGNNSLAAASDVNLTPGAVGHYLFTPYYSAQQTTATLFNITNTDLVNGKAVKVRFRGAANSDDVLDFTVFLSPGDVWTATVAQDASGKGSVTTTDKSCTLPAAASWPAPFSTARLAPYLSAAVAAQNANEGYIEVLNMADIPPNLLDAGKGTVNAGVAKGGTNNVYTAIKHVGGVAPCTPTAFADLLNTTVLTTAADANGYGLSAPSGGLMGSWAIFNQGQLAVYGGNDTAIVAHNNWSTGDRALTPVHANGLIAFAPQDGSSLTAADITNLPKYTADPLLRSGAISPLWFDLPDMSSPLATPFAADAVQQANALSQSISRNFVYNDYVATAAGAAVPMQTDWVVSQPTRRYHAAVQYGASAATAAIRWNIDMTAAGTLTTTAQGSVINNAYAPLTLSNTAMGPQACITAFFSSTDREEKVNVAGGGFSPGVSNPYCGEVFTVQFGATSVLQAMVTTRAVTPVGESGWARLALSGTSRLPLVGFAATSFKNTATNGNFGLTLPHRWMETN